MNRYVVLEKAVGETPLERLENYRVEHAELAGIPMAYAGRLDPMASGKLLILIGDECKKQAQYHGLDKEYVVEVVFGVHSDSGDVLGIVEESGSPQVSERNLRRTLKKLTGEITLPYPKFSSKTVQGKPLHTWTMEGRLHEIEIPTYTAHIYKLELKSFSTKTRSEIYEEVSEKIETIPPVTDQRKALGNDFRRPEVRASWKTFHDARTNPLPRVTLGRGLVAGTTSCPRVTLGQEVIEDEFTVATIRVTGSSGLYMRTVAGEIAKHLDTSALAYSIHRTKIGRYKKTPFINGFWTVKY